MTASNEPIDQSEELFQSGNQVGRYRLIGPLAAGGMAHIWAARNGQNRFARTIVLKVIRSEFATDEEYRRMLVDEATAAAAIHHPNVCEIFELGSHRNTLFIAMEWVAGDSLSGILKQCNSKGLPLPLAARMIANAAAGLHAAHEAIGPDGLPLGIVHRDVSPQNILLSVSGQVKVSDFGIAKARDQLHAKTRTGNIKGKFAYIPPEQVKGAPVDRRADIYALGAVLYVTATGARPFGSGAQSALSKIIRGDFPKPRDVVPDFDPLFEQVILKAMAYNPDQRYQTSDEFRAALEKWLAQRGEVVTETDIARAVKARLSPSASARLQALRVGPEALQRLARESITGSLTTEGTPSHAVDGTHVKKSIPPAASADPRAERRAQGSAGTAGRTMTPNPAFPSPQRDVHSRSGSNNSGGEGALGSSDARALPKTVSQSPPRRSLHPPPDAPQLADEVPTRRPPAQGGTAPAKPRWYERFAPKRSH